VPFPSSFPILFLHDDRCCCTLTPRPMINHAVGEGEEHHLQEFHMVVIHDLTPSRSAVRTSTPWSNSSCPRPVWSSSSSFVRRSQHVREVAISFVVELSFCFRSKVLNHISLCRPPLPAAGKDVTTRRTNEVIQIEVVVRPCDA
jgi:hypothetical protein